MTDTPVPPELSRENHSQLVTWVRRQRVEHGAVAAVAAAEAARKVAEQAWYELQTDLIDMRRTYIAEVLKEQGDLRKAGAALGISHTRVAQILDGTIV